MVDHRDRPGGLQVSSGDLFRPSGAMHIRADRSVTPKAPAGGSRGLGSGHSISMGKLAVGPPRSGFVLCDCICKSDEVWGEAVPPRPCRYKILQITSSV